MKFTKSLISAMLFASVLGADIALAADATSSTSQTSKTSSCELINPQVFTQTQIDSVIAILKRDKDKINTDFVGVEKDIENALKPAIAIEFIAQYVAGKAWSSATTQQQRAFEAVLLTYIANTYSSALRSFNHQTMKAFPSRIKDWKTQSRIQISAIIHNPDATSNADIPVAFVLMQDGCSWLFLDFVVDNISAMASVQQQIQGLKVADLAALTKLIDDHNKAVNS